MPPRLSLRDLALVLGVVALFGYSFVMIKVALRETQPFALAAARFALAAFPACLFVPRPRMPTRAVVAYGFAIGVIQFGLLFLAIHLGMAAGVVSVVIQVQVFFTMALAMVFLHERLHAHNAIGALIAAAGVAVLAVHGLVNGAAATLLGFALV